jgi:integrase
MGRWEAAYASWIETLTPSQRYAGIQRFVANCLAFCGCLPWELDAQRVQKWLDEGLANMSTTTGRKYVKVVRRFYEYARQHPLLADSEPAEHPGYNPTGGVRLPACRFYEGIWALSRTEVSWLLGAIDRESLLGARDYALYLILLASGFKIRAALISAEWTPAVGISPLPDGCASPTAWARPWKLTSHAGKSALMVPTCSPAPTTSRGSSWGRRP